MPAALKLTQGPASVRVLCDPYSSYRNTHISFQKLDISTEDPKDRGSRIIFVQRERGDTLKGRGVKGDTILAMNGHPHAVILSLVFPE